MIVTVVKVFVKEGYAEDFIKATVENHNKSIHEKENLRFDILQSKEDPNLFTLYEAYMTEEGIKAHKETEQYLTWRETVADWMAKPREGMTFEVVAPEDIDSWNTLK